MVEDNKEHGAGAEKDGEAEQVVVGDHVCGGRAFVANWESEINRIDIYCSSYSFLEEKMFCKRVLLSS